MKNVLKRVNKTFRNEISFAKSAGFEGILMQLDSNLESNSSIFLEIIYDTDTLEEIAMENGWHDDFAFFDFTNNRHTMIHLHDKVA